MNLKVTLIQTNLVWENIEANLEVFDEKLKKLKNQTNIVVLPEMFTTGFSMDTTKCAETMEGKGVKWMQQKARELNLAVTGSLIIEENGHYFNRFIWADETGRLLHYDKKHLFTMGEEDQHFTAGSDRIIIHYKEWNICPLICYDLRFPVWSRNSLTEGKAAYDCLIYMANWPSARRNPWMKLLEARAIENQSYVVGVNRVGIDGTGKEYSGDSMTVDPKGEIISNIPTEEDYIQTLELSKSMLNEFREKFPILVDADRYKLI